MTEKNYTIFLDNIQIGVTKLEKADASMGITFGEILFTETISGYDFFKAYCLENKIEFEDFKEDRLLTTNNIPTLQVFDNLKNEIKGIACSVSGLDTDGFEITLLGIPYPFYEEEFPHHVKAYNEMYKS
jgi:hypothetical protein